MSFGGHVADMVARYRVNMSMLTKKRYFNKSESKYENRHEKPNDKLQQASPKELNAIRTKMIGERKKEKV